MAFPSGTAYHADSDADDEYERSVMTSPTQLHTDSEASPSDSEPPSAEHTPTTYAHSGEDRSTPRTVITEWTTEESADFLASLGLRQYCDAFIENEIVGEALIALKHDELKEMGINSVGHRLTILKGVYEIKVSQDIHFESDHYVPLSAEQSRQNEVATQEDVQRIIQSLRLRDERIIQAESELRKLADDYRRLREELLPVFRMVKDHSQPLPYGPNSQFSASQTSPELYNHSLISPPVEQRPSTNEKSGTSLTRTFSKKLFLGSTPKNNSPTHIPNTIHEGRALADNTSLDPSAAATAASNHLTAQMSSGLSASSIPNNSPSAIPQPSPTSPAPYQPQTLASRSYNRGDGNTSAPTTSRSTYDSHTDEPMRSNTTPQPLSNGPTSASKLNPQNNTLASSSASIAPSTKGDSSRDRTNTASSNAAPPSAAAADPAGVEIFKSFRVGLEDPCYKVLPAALRKYNIQADWRQYALYIVFGDQERCVGLEEKPLSLFKQYDKEGKKPMFMLRKLAQGFEGVEQPAQGGGGGGTGLGVGGLRDVSSSASLRGPMSGFNVPGGVL